MTKIRLGIQGQDEQHNKPSTGEARAKSLVRKAKWAHQEVFVLDAPHGSRMSIGYKGMNDLEGMERRRVDHYETILRYQD